jgi:hypothetical protein
MPPGVLSTSIERSAEPVLQRYTAFPNLYITANPRAQADVSELTFEIPNGINKESVILSWAILLRGYTGLDSVTFEVDDGQAVCVDFEHDSVEDTRASTSAEEKSRYTALCFDKVRLAAAGNVTNLLTIVGRMYLEALPKCNFTLILRPQVRLWSLPKLLFPANSCKTSCINCST